MSPRKGPREKLQQWQSRQYLLTLSSGGQFSAWGLCKAIYKAGTAKRECDSLTNEMQCHHHSTKRSIMSPTPPNLLIGGKCCIRTALKIFKKKDFHINIFLFIAIFAFSQTLKGNKQILESDVPAIFPSFFRMVTS